MSGEMKDKILAACRADWIPEGASGLWYIRKWQIAKPLFVIRDKKDGSGVTLQPGRYTNLLRWTDATLHLGMGELVMHDEPNELRKHLNFMLRARGNVLITGLGLGCVVRGTLANPAVKHVTVVERDADVLKLVQPHMPTERLTIIHDDAISFCKATNQQFDCAWHDIWSDNDEPNLILQHTELLCALALTVPRQGAWDYPREYKRGLCAIR
jgi:hypothetical protein